MSKGYEVFKALEVHHNNPNTKVEFEKPYAEGISFSLSDHIRGMILAMLSLQRDFGPIEKHICDIEKIYYYYDAEKIKAADPEALTKAVKGIKCGNRRIKFQSKALKHNIEYLESIQKEFGKIDTYYRSMSKYELVNTLNSHFREMGTALISEYLPYVGIDLPKSDSHLKRFLGNNRLGLSKKENATANECFGIIHTIALESGEREKYIDYLFWCYCSDSRDDICGAIPNCEKCIIKEYCNMNKK